MQMDTKISQTTLKHAREIAGLRQNIFALEKRVDDNTVVTTGIHKLAASMEILTAEVKGLAERLENGLRGQGKRIGEAETALINLANVENQVKNLTVKVDTIEKEPAQKWKDMSKQIISLVVAAVVGAVITYVIR